MPAPENLNTQTPGETNTQPAPEDTGSATDGQALQQTTETAETPPALVFTPLHKGGGKYVVVDASGEAVGAFKGTKAEAEAEALRLTAGGEPQQAATTTTAEPTNTQPAPAAKPAAVDPTKLKQPVLTPEGWLCPELKQEG